MTVNHRKLKKQFFRIGAWKLLVVFTILCACRQDKNTEIQLTFWAMGGEGEHVKLLIPKFEKENPRIKINVQSVPWGAAYEKLLTAYAGNALPDVCQLGNTWIPQFAMLNALHPLDSLINRSKHVNAKRYFEGIWKTNIINGRVFGLPWYVDTRLLFYRKDVLEKAGYPYPPQTWEEWLNVSRKIKSLDTQKYAAFFSLILNDWQVPVILIMSNGGRLLKSNDCYGAFDDPKTVEALKFYLQFFKEGLAPKTMTEFTNIYQGFTNADFSMMVTGPWNVAQIRERSPELTGKWSTAPIPAKQNRASVAGGASLVIFQSTNHLSAAWKFITFLSKTETQERFFRLMSDLPAVRDAWNAPALKNDREIHAFYEQLETVLPTPPIAEWEQIAVKIQEHLESVVYEQATLPEAIEQLNHEVDRILEKRRWLLKNKLLMNRQ